MTGVKGMLFTDNNVADAFRIFWDSNNIPDINNPDGAYSEAVKRLSGDVNFDEEIDHFSIVSRTSTARVLYVWNILCRMSYSAYYYNKKITSIKNICPIHREIVRYNLAYMCFFFAASPLLEESFEKRTGKGGHHGGLHGPDIQAARTFLESLKPLPSHEFLAKVVDRAFVALWRHRRERGMAVSYTDKGSVAGFGVQAVRLWLIGPVFTSLRAFGLVCWRFLYLLFAMRGHFVRLITTGANNRKIDGLQSETIPAILSPEGAIDPDGFSANRQYWGSLELSRISKTDEVQSNLLWYVLSQCAETAAMIKANIDKTEIEGHFEARWKFYSKGFFKNQDTLNSTAIIDYEIIDKMFDFFEREPNKIYEANKIAEIGLDIFYRVALQEMDESIRNNYLDSFAQAFGITYMQV